MAITLGQFIKHWLFILRNLWLTLLCSNAKRDSESKVAISCLASCLATDTTSKLFQVLPKFCFSFKLSLVLEFDTDLLTIREEKRERKWKAKCDTDSEVGTVLFSMDLISSLLF